MAEPRLIPEDEQALFNQSAASLPEELRQDARLDFEAGLLRADLQPTQRGQFEINLTQQFEPKEQQEVRGFFNRGLIDRNLQKTQRGELYFSDLDTVLDQGEQAFYEWVKLGAWDEHSDRTGEDPVLEQVGAAMKSLATEVVPDAVGVAAQGITTNTPFITAADWLGGLGIPEGVPFFGAFTKMRKARESARLSIKGLRDVSRKELAAGFGSAAAAAMDNQVVMDRGRQYLQAKMQAGVTGAVGDLFSKGLGKADDAVILSLYDFEKSKKAMRDLSADEAAAAIASIATLGDEAAKMEAAEFAATTSAAARQGFTKAELADIDRRNANYGMIGTDISMPFTPAASMVAKGARVVGKKVGGTLLGRTTLHTLDKSERHLAALTARQQAVANSGSAPIAPLNAAGMKQTGARAARRAERAQAAQKTLQKLDDEIYEAKKIVQRHRTRLEGIGSQFKQGTRSLAQGMTTALARAGKTPLGEKALSVGSTIDEFFMNLQSQGGASSKAQTGLRALGFVGLTTGNPAAALAFPSIVSRNYRILKGAAEMIHATGSEFFKRRVSMPYWQRVSERVAKNPWGRNGALTIDALATPLKPVRAAGKNLAASMTRATITEIPFAAMASGGEPGFLVEAIAEGGIFGSAGHVQGLIHGLGGAPAIMKRQEFDLLAQNDAAELRRNLGLKQREIFDGMDPVIRRQLGVASALFPDLDFKFVPGSGGGAFHQRSKTVFIDPESKNPLDVLLAHEIGHALAARGMTRRVREDLVGPQGMLMDQDGNLTKEAQEFRREYEKRFGQKIDNNQLADEWFAEAVAPGLLKTQRLQKLVGRNKMIGGWVDSVLPKIPFAKRVLLQRGVLLDKKGNLAPGQGVMVSASLSPALARLADSYLRANAGSTFIPGGKKVPGTDKIVGGRTVEDLQRRTVYTRQDEMVMEERNMIDYERDPKTGRVIRDRFGRPKDVSPDILAAQATTLGNTIRKVAERNGLLPQSQKRGGDRFDNFEQKHWDEVVNEVRKTGLYNDSQLDAMRTAFSSKAANDGKAHVFQYQKALDTNERTGKKKYSPKPQENRVGSIYSIEVTKQNNVILRLIDIDALEANAIKAAASPEGIKKYGGDSAKIMRDLLVLAKNHSEAGKDNAIEFGEETAQFLNGVMGSLSKEHSSNNPKVIGGRPPVRSFRLDRANFIRETAEDGLPFNHHQWLKGLMPEPADATNQQSDAQGETRSISERGITPGSTGQRGNSTISRGASAGRAGEAQQVLAGVQETAKRHKFGFAVDVKPQSFYNDPANTIYRNGDAGAAVTEGGDLVSVYSVPGGKGNIDAVLTDASQDAKTLDAFDIGGFLPNLYNRYGFKVVARVPFNREYAPPGWDFDAAGEPDVVLAVNDPSAEAVDYNEVRDSVPVFEDWDEAEAYRDKIAKELDDAKADDIRRMPEDPTALPIVEARNADGSVKLNKKGKVVYESIDYDLVNAPGLKAVQSTPEDARTPDYDSLHYHITRKDRAAIDELIESGALDEAAGDLAADAEAAMLDPEIAAGIGWYSRMRQKLRQALGEDHQLFAELLGATSANTDVEQNFIYAFDAYRQFKAGKFDRMLAKFNEAVDLIESDTLVDVMVARRIVTKSAAKRLDQIELLKKWIKRYNLEPRRPDGKRYGMNSAHVFNALSGNFTKVRGPKAKDKLSPKTPQFSMNLFGSSLEATIDVWAARYLRRKLYAPTVKQWRIQPKSETGVSNADFLVGQEIFGRAAAKLGMNPDDLQALMWFKEKEVWDVSGWTKGAGALKSSFDEAADAFFPPNQQIKPKELAQANRVGLNSLNFIRKRRGVESKVKKLESLANQTGSKVTTAKRELRNAKAEFTKARKRAGVADFLERNPQLR